MSNKVDIVKFFKSIMICYMNLEKSKYLTYNEHFFDKGNIHFEAGAIDIDGNT